MWQKEVRNEGIRVCNASMVHRPRKTSKESSKDAQILKVSLLLTIHALITTSGQTFRKSQYGLYGTKGNIPQSGVQGHVVFNLCIHTCMHSVIHIDSEL